MKKSRELLRALEALGQEEEQGRGVERLGESLSGSTAGPRSQPQQRYIWLQVCTDLEPEGPFNCMEFSLRPGMPVIEISGLAPGRAKALVIRVVAAIKAAGFRLSKRRVSISLQREVGPGDLRLLDLPLALGLLHLSGAIELPKGLLVGGQVLLDGSLQAGPELLQLVLRNRHWRQPMLLGLSPGQRRRRPPELQALSHLCELRTAGDLGPIGRYQTEDFYQPPELVQRLQDLGHCLQVEQLPEAAERLEQSQELLELPRQELGLLAVKAAALGGHHLLMVGSAGCGKSRLAELLEALLPPPRESRLLERWSVYSALSKGAKEGWEGLVPCIYPSSTLAQLQGRRGRPGLLSQAHGFLLRCEELPQFSLRLLMLLQEALDEGRVQASAERSWPCRFQLVALGNPCACGRYYEQDPGCSCALGSPSIWTRRLPRSLLDRLDIRLIMRSPRLGDFRQLEAQEQRASYVQLADLRSNLEEARHWRQETWMGAGETAGEKTTAELAREGQQQVFGLHPRALELAQQEAQRRGLSLRSYRLLLGVARSLADLAREEAVGLAQMVQALEFMPGREGQVQVNGG